METQPPRRSVRLREQLRMNSDIRNSRKIVFHVVDILLNVITHCSWGTIVNISHVNIHGQRTVYTLLRRRIRTILLPFIDDIPNFLALLKEVKAGIVGSAVWNILTIDDVEPRDLNIIIPSGIPYGIERVKAYIASSGTSVIFDGAPGIIYEAHTARFIKVLRPTGKTITITLSKSSSIVPVVVSSSFTCQFNILTATSIICFYPDLLSRRETARGMSTIYLSEFDQLVRRGIWCLGPNTPRETACGNACLALWRRTEGLEGVAVMHWGGYSKSPTRDYSYSFTEEIGSSNLKWRLGERCFNTKCPNSTNLSLI
ncbi:hypothetical protein BYT27DRAFT_7260166 [Phlegmacium glaucopus]|nr:hypothetical protein BYT27DRAFT_7260166 [Phlegmacium glaucopus]